jgi:DNA replication protein
MKDYVNHGVSVVSNLVFEYASKIGLSDAEILLWLQLFRFQSQGENLPGFEKIANAMNKPKSEVFKIYDDLNQHKAIEFVSKDGKDYYSLYPLLILIENYLANLEGRVDEKSKQEDVLTFKTLRESFEQEFGRLLTPIEIKKIQDWIDVDQFPMKVVELALREAVLNKVYNFNYIDKVLLNWKQLNLQSENDLKEYLSERRLAKFDRELKDDSFNYRK